MATVKHKPISYFGVKLSDNVIKTPEGYLIFKDAVIARTGFQLYKAKELPQDELQDLGLKFNPDDDVNVYRSPEEVFSTRAIRSFEGKPVTDMHPDDGKLLTIETVEDYSCGHIQNVRQGEEPLENGDLPLLADIHVHSASLIAKWNAGIRELSCGYNYHIIKDSNGNIFMVDIVGNHVAFVENGRAGIHVRVNDSKPQENLTMEQQHEIAFGEGIKTIAEKSTGSQLGAFFAGLLSFTGRKPAVAMDAETHVTGCKCDECKGGKDAAPVVAAAKDAKATDRERMHKALDKHLDGMDNAAEEQHASDEADMTALKGIFTAKPAGATDSEEEQEEAGKEAAEEEETEATDSDKDDSAMDEAVQSEAAPIIPVGDRPKPDVPAAVDAAYRAGAESVLRGLKPFVARSKNKALTGAFDTTSKLVKGTGWRGSASYAGVVRAAGIGRDAAAQHHDVDVDTARADKATNAYAEARKSYGKK